MKKVVWCVLLLLLLLPLGGAYGEQADSTPGYDVEAEVDSYGLDALDGYTGDAVDYFTDGASFSDTVRALATGETVLDAKSVLRLIVQGLFGEGYDCLALLLSVIAISVLFSLLNNMKSSFNKETVSEIAFFVCYLILSGIIVQAFGSAAKLVTNTVRTASIFINALAPVLMTMLVTSGGIVSAAAVNPVILLAAELSAVVVERLLMPLLYSSAALYIVSEINETIRVVKFADFLKKTVKWGLCLILTVFVGILSIQGFCSVPLDGAAAKTAKYVVGTAVPVVGSILSDTVETVVGCSMVVKNATGAAGMIAVLVIVTAPILRLLAVCAVFHISAAVIEPIADKRIANVMSNIASVTSLMAAVVITVALLFIICIGMVMCIGAPAV